MFVREYMYLRHLFPRSSFLYWHLAHDVSFYVGYLVSQLTVWMDHRRTTYNSGKCGFCRITLCECQSAWSLMRTCHDMASTHSQLPILVACALRTSCVALDYW